MNSATSKKFQDRYYGFDSRSVLFEYEPLGNEAQDETIEVNSLLTKLRKANSSGTKFERVAYLRNLAHELEETAAKLRCQARKELMQQL